MANWSEIPRDLLLLIAKYLENLFDVLKFRSVCRNWRASVPLNFRPPTFRSPFHFRTHKYGSEFLLWERSVCLFEFPAVNNRTTPRLWLVSLEEDECGKKHIIDPLYLGHRSPIQYPMVLDMSQFHVQELGRQYIDIHVISHHGVRTLDIAAYMNINDDDFIVMGRSLWCLNYFKHRDQELTKIHVEGFDHCWDSIQFERKFYAVDCFGNTCSIDPFSGAYFLLEKTSVLGRGYKVLIQLCENLLFAELIRSTVPTPTFKFEVFQLDKERKRWDRLESLGKGILFFGKYGKFSAPMIPGVKGNCIVFSCQVAGATVKDKKGGALVFDMSGGMTVPLDHRPDLLQLFCPPSFL